MTSQTRAIARLFDWWEITLSDTLLELLERQWEIEKTFRPIEAANGFWPQFANPDTDFPVDLNDPHAQAFVKDAMFRVAEEMFEAANHLKNRPWKQTQRETNHGAFHEETADFTHFYLRYLLIVYGRPQWALEAIRVQYLAKAEVNHQRATEGV